MSRFMKPVMPVRNKQGFDKVCVSQEYNGSVDGVHTIALGVCSVPSVKNSSNIDSPWFLVGMEILRRIFKKHYGAIVQNSGQSVDMLIPPVFQTQTGLIDNQPRLTKIQFYHSTISDGSLGTPTIGTTFSIAMPLTTATDRSIGTLAYSLGDQLKSYFGFDFSEKTGGNTAQNFTSRNVIELYGYSLEEIISLSGPDATPSIADASNRVISQIYRMDNWIMDMTYITKIRMQNVSPSTINDNGTYKYTTDMSLNEQNILVGKLYHFTDPFPVPNLRLMSVTNTSTLNGNPELNDFHVYGKDSNGDGIVKVNGTDLLALRQIPTPDYWRNVTGYSLIKLRPGEIKTHKMRFKFNGYINKLFRGLQVTYAYNGGTNNLEWLGRTSRERGLGTFDLFCFEDYNGANLPGSNIDPNIGMSFQLTRFGTCKHVKSTFMGMDLVRSYANPVTTVATDT